MGGEKCGRNAVRIGLLGSPPRGRGKGGLALLKAMRPRITPAWAGKSGKSAVKAVQLKDHPRVGGEKDLPHQVIVSVLGSPPRGRGKVSLGSAFGVLLRITPAWAGKRPRRGCALT